MPCDCSSTVSGGYGGGGDENGCFRNLKLNESSFLASLMAKKETGADRFIEANPNFDGRGVVIAIFDSGVGPAAAGLQVTSDGKPKILDVIDCTGSGDIDTSNFVKADSDGCILGASGASLIVNSSWKNPSGEWHIGYKLVYGLLTSTLTSRLKKERKKKWDGKNQEEIAKAVKHLDEFNQKHSNPEDANLKRLREELQNRVEILRKQADSYDDKGSVIDAVVWHDGEVWRAALDTQNLDDDPECGELVNFQPLTNYRTERKYGVFSKLDACTVVLNIYDEGNISSIVTDHSPHGTHVSGIATAYHQKEPLLNGVAPGAQLISCKSGDSCLGSMETGTGLTRALVAAVEADGIRVSPYSVENTIGVDKLSTGQELMQVDKAYEYIQQSPNLQCVRYEVKINRSGKTAPTSRGIYLREASACAQSTEWTVQVEPKFHEGADNLEELVSFEECIELYSTDKAVVQAPEYLLLTHNGRSFNIVVDPTKLTDGLHHYEVCGLDCRAPWRGPLLRISVTISKPMTIKNRPPLVSFQKMSFVPGMAILLLWLTCFSCCICSSEKLLVGMTLVHNASALGAFCLDGSLPAYHLHRGFGAGARNWLLQFEGGGWCNDIESCLDRAKTRRGSTLYMNKKEVFSGILSNNASLNPDFYNWNRVKLRYCDGGSFAGDAKFDNGTSVLYFKGQKIWEVIILDLLPKGLTKARKALLSGCSAGGLSSFLHCDNFANVLPKNASVKCLSDAGFFMDEKDINSNYTFRSVYKDLVSLQGIQKNLNKNCTRLLADPRLCIFPQYVLRFIQTPYFILNSAYDVFQFNHILVPPSSDLHGHWKSCKLSISQCNETQISILQGFRHDMLSALLSFYRNSNRGGMYINSCFAHCQSELQETWFAVDSPRVHNKTIARAVGDWYFSRNVTKEIDCPYPCDKTCYNLISSV